MVRFHGHPQFWRKRIVGDGARCVFTLRNVGRPRGERLKALFIFAGKQQDKKGKRKRKNFKEQFLYFKGATGGLNKKLLSVVRLRHQKKAISELLRPISIYQKPNRKYKWKKITF